MLSLRPYQIPLWNYLDKGGKRAVIVWHRRAGKDLLCWNYTVTEACTGRPGTYTYYFPTASLAKKVIWDGADKSGRRFLDFIPPQLIKRLNSTEMKIELYNGNIIRLAGTDKVVNVGTNPVGTIFSEFSLQNPRSWNYIRPILAENDGWALFNGCVKKDSLIITEYGLRSIHKAGNVIAQYSPLNKPIYGLGGFHEATDFYYGGPKELIKITTKKGYTLSCTPNHQLWNGSEWKRSDEWSVGDIIPIQIGQGVFSQSELDISSWAKPQKKSNQGNWKSLSDNFLSLDMFYLMGLYLAEGSQEKQGVRRGARLTITNTDQEIIYFLNRMGWVTARDGIHHRYSGTELASFFSWFGLRGTAKEKNLPQKLFECRKDQVVAFLQGYFDGDGTAGKRGSGYIKVCSASFDLIHQLQILLCMFGIVSRVSITITPPTKKVIKECVLNNLEIEGHFAWMFFEQIGFRLTRKQARKDLISLKARLGRGDIVPIAYDKVEYELPKNIVTNPARINYRTIRKLQDQNPSKYFSQILNDGFYYDTIAKIEEDEGEVYDFVIPETHSFFSNGFISHNTPRGRNHFYELYEMAKSNPDWFCQSLTVDDTKAVSDEAIEIERRAGMSEDLILQEFYVSWDCGVQGAIFGRQMMAARNDNRIGHVPYDENLLVYTAWDIGIGDCTAIVFFQIQGESIRIIDHYENSGFALAHYINLLKTKPFAANYGGHFVPHDAQHKNQVTGHTYVSGAAELGVDMTTIPLDYSIEEKIECARGLFSRIFIDERKCDYLIKCLLQYHYEFDDNAKRLRDRPDHDWSSHSSDSLMYLCLAVKNGMVGSRGKGRWDALKAQHGYYGNNIPVNIHTQRFIP